MSAKGSVQLCSSVWCCVCACTEWLDQCWRWRYRRGGLGWDDGDDGGLDMQLASTQGPRWLVANVSAPPGSFEFQVSTHITQSRSGPGHTVRRCSVRSCLRPPTSREPSRSAPNFPDQAAGGDVSHTVWAGLHWHRGTPSGTLCHSLHCGWVVGSVRIVLIVVSLV
jgi:hypothetical protein